MEIVHGNQLEGSGMDGLHILDVREKIELKKIGQIEGAVHIPMDQIEMQYAGQTMNLKQLSLADGIYLIDIWDPAAQGDARHSFQ